MAVNFGFQSNERRLDPYKNFKFRVQMEEGGTFVPLLVVSKISPLKRSTEVVSHRHGGDVSTPRHAPGQTSYEPITFERGVTFDTAFERWTNQVFDNPEAGDGAISLAGYKRDLLIEVRNLQDVVVKRYRVFRAWVSEYTALPELDANANAVMLESVVVQNEGWEREEVEERQES